MQPEGRIYLPSSGKVFHFENPEDPEVYELEDIALGLSRQNRYVGQTMRHLKTITVAEHSVLVAFLTDILTQHYPQNERSEIILQAFMHDAPEAYITDLPRPLKQVLPDYIAYEKRVWKGITQKFKIVEPLFNEVLRADRHACYLETQCFVHPNSRGFYDNCRDPELHDLHALPEFRSVVLPHSISPEHFVDGFAYIKEHGTVFSRGGKD